MVDNLGRIMLPFTTQFHMFPYVQIKASEENGEIPRPCNTRTFNFLQTQIDQQSESPNPASIMHRWQVIKRFSAFDQNWKHGNKKISKSSSHIGRFLTAPKFVFQSQT